MTTVKEALISATQRLLKTSSSPRLDAELILSHILNISKIKLFSEWNKNLSEEHLALYESLVLRRMRHEPVAYLTGNKEFYGRRFDVSSAVLIPRPDTETLIEQALALSSKLSSVSLLDLGTGSGCIAVTLVAEMLSRGQPAKGVAIDKSLDALTIARHNAERHGVDSLIEFAQGDWLNNVSGTFDLILSNPPYISKSDISLSKETKFEPSVALFSGDSGLDDILNIAKSAHRHLVAGGCLICETGAQQHGALTSEFQSLGFDKFYCEPEWIKDLSEHDRVFVLRKLF